MKTIFACMMLPALLAAADPDELRLRTSLAGGPIRGVVPDGHADFKLRPSRGSMAFSVEVEDVQLPAGTRLDILVNGAYVGQMAVSGPPAMGAELELNTQDGAQVPALKAGDVIEVRAGSAVLLSGVLQTTPLIDSLRNSPPRSTVPTTSAGASLPQPTGQEPARLRTPLTGGALAGLQPSGHLDFRTDSARGITRLSVEVEDVNLPVGTLLQVEVEGRVVTTFRLGAGGFAELELDSRNGDLVNQIRAGAGVRILSPNGPILSGGMQLITPSTNAGSTSGGAQSGANSSSPSTTGGNGETRVRTPLAGGAVNGLQPSGKADFRVRGAGSRLNVEIEDVNLPPGSVVDVFVGNQRIGTITVGPPPMRGGELELNTNDGATVPAIRPGDQITIRTAAQGVLVTGVVQTFSFSEVPPVPPAAGSGNSSNSGGSNSNANQAGDDRGGNSGNSGSGSSNSGSGSGNSGSGSSNSGSGSGNSGSGSGNSGSGSGNSGSGSSNSGSGSGNSGSGSGNSGSGSSNSGSGGSGSSNGGSGSGKGGGSDDPPGHN
ncbi:MAG: hypothetical protein J0L64_12615 [Acidobacteria bacterium]|nr:hypothetical protein [Acidobacteriota bacterium]